MSKLTTESTQKFDSLIQTSMIAGIKKLVIESGKIRGIDEKQQVVIVTSNNVPDLGGKQIGISRLDSLCARLSLIKNQGSLDITATEHPTEKQDIAQLDLSSGKVKAQFRCSTVSAVKGVPKTISDSFVWEIKLESKYFPTIVQAVSAMGSEAVTIASKDGKTVVVELVDANKDVFTTELSDNIKWISTKTASTSFCHKYPAKPFVSIMKESLKSNDKITIGEGGMLSLLINGFDFYLLPTQ